MIEQITQTEGGYLVTINGQDMTVPNAPANEDYQRVQEALREGAKLVKQPYVEPVPRRVGEFREFMELFTPEEQVALVGASMKNVQVKVWYDKAMGGPSFSLDHHETKPGMGFLVEAGLITQARSDAILDGNFDD